MTRVLEVLETGLAAESRAAARAIINLCQAEDGPAIAQTARGLLPNRRVLQTLIGVFQSTTIPVRQRVLPVVRHLLQALAEDRLTGTMLVELAIIYLPVEELITWLSRRCFSAGGGHRSIYPAQ